MSRAHLRAEAAVRQLTMSNTAANTTTSEIGDDASRVKPMVERLHAGFASGATLSFEYREQQLKNLLRGFTELKDKINAALKADLGLTDFHCYFYSTDAITAELTHTLENFRKWGAKKEVPTPEAFQPATSYLMPEPFGAVLILAPWNFPLTCSIPYLGSAIAAGNVACVKPSELAPNCSRVTVELIEKYLDPACYAVIEGAGGVANALIHEKWDLMVFTGSPEKGKLVARAAAENLTPCILELGGKNPAYVDKDADLDNAAMRICDVKLYNWGQSCDSPDYCLVAKDVAKELVAKMAKYMKQFYGEQPSKSYDMTKIVNAMHVRRLESAFNEAHGGEVIFAGDNGKCNVESRYVPPAIILNPRLDSQLMTGEIFGPFLPVVVVDDLKAAINFINARPKPLAAHYFGAPEGAGKDEFIRRTSSGGVCINDSLGHFASAELPFGGVGYSGTGAVHGKYGFDGMCHMKPVMERGTDNSGAAAMRFPPYGPNRLKELGITP